jgi:1-acyl-sn-glycerol-3-phosphate acyltransferase
LCNGDKKIIIFAICTNNPLSMMQALRYLYLTYASIMFVVLMIIVLPFIVLPFLLGEKLGGKIAYVSLMVWSYAYCSSIGIRYRCIDKHKVDKKQSYIYTCNHNSFMDSPAIVATIPGQFRPLGKVEMNKIPIFNLIYRHVVVMVDRSSPESRRASLNAMKAKLRQQISVLIFPEGSMNRTSQTLTPFYDGAFRLAIETQTPIMPVVLVGTRQVMPRAKNFITMRPGVVTTIFSDPIPTEGLTLADAPALKAQVFSIMENIVLAHQPATTVAPVAQHVSTNSLLQA